MLKNIFRAFVKTIALPATLFYGFILLIINLFMYFIFWFHDKQPVDPYMKQIIREDWSDWIWWMKFWDGSLK